MNLLYQSHQNLLYQSHLLRRRYRQRQHRDRHRHRHQHHHQNGLNHNQKMKQDDKQSKYHIQSNIQYRQQAVMRYLFPR